MSDQGKQILAFDAGYKEGLKDDSCRFRCRTEKQAFKEGFEAGRYTDEGFKESQEAFTHKK